MKLQDKEIDRAVIIVTEMMERDDRGEIFEAHVRARNQLRAVNRNRIRIFWMLSSLQEEVPGARHGRQRERRLDACGMAERLSTASSEGRSWTM
jgi:hypothetical protein